MIYPFQKKFPVIHKNTFIAPNATIIGDVQIQKESSIWFHVTIRGDVHYITIGEKTNIQDNSVIHVTDQKYPTIIGNHVTVGHSATIHGATIHNYCLVGIGATILDQAELQPFSFVAAGSLVPPNMKIPENTLVAGVPAKIIRKLKTVEIEFIKHNSLHYSKLAKEYQKNFNIEHN